MNLEGVIQVEVDRASMQIVREYVVGLTDYLSVSPAKLTERDLELCVLECFRQGATSPPQLTGLVTALHMAKEIAMTRKPGEMSVREVLGLEASMALFIEPQWADYRKMPAVFLHGGSAVTHTEIPRLMRTWAEAFAEQSGTPEELYKFYEDIHPHGDGNGRNGLCTWAISTYWQTGVWPTQLPPDMYA